MNTLPKNLFVTLENSKTEDEYLAAAEDKETALALLEIGGTKIVGEYELKRQFQVKGVAQEIK